MGKNITLWVKRGKPFPNEPNHYSMSKPIQLASFKALRKMKLSLCIKTLRLSNDEKSFFIHLEKGM